MTLKQFLDLNWDAVKYYLSIGDNYIPGAIFYRLTEMDINGFTPKTFISKKLLKHKNFNDFKKQPSRHNLNKTVKKHFGKDFFVEHIVPKKHILAYWKACNDKKAFEKYMRENASICFLSKAENKMLPKTDGREIYKDALAVYKKCGIETVQFNFDFEKSK